MIFPLPSKVKELRDALEERGLDSKGVKAVLKERLLEALAKENAGTEDVVETPSKEASEEPSVGDLNGHAEDSSSMVRGIDGPANAD